MSHSEDLADRIRAQLGEQVPYEEAEFMDGLGFFADGRLIAGVLGDSLCVRLDEPAYLDQIEGIGVEPYEFAGRPVPGWLAMKEADLDDDRLTEWLTAGLPGRDG